MGSCMSEEGLVGCFREEVLGAEGAIGKEIQRVAGGLIKDPMGDLQASQVINRIALVQLDWRSLGKGKHWPPARVAIDVAQSDTTDAERSGDLEVLSHLVHIVLRQHARELDCDSRCVGNDVAEVRHLVYSMELVVGLLAKRVDGDCRRVVHVEHIDLGWSEQTIRVQ